MARRWSKLQTRLYNIMDNSIDFQIHCALYEMNSNDGYHGAKLPRYFITVGKEIVFDYPKDFDKTQTVYGHKHYPYITDMSHISEVIEDYLQCSKDKLLQPFEKDEWGITNVLRICDRRIGKRSLLKLRETTEDETLLKIIDLRLK